MAYLSFLVSFVSFLILALAGLMDWNLGDFDPLAWGLTFLALGHFLGGGLAYLTRRV